MSDEKFPTHTIAARKRSQRNIAIFSLLEADQEFSESVQP
jgi:hypothetical protein